MKTITLLKPEQELYVPPEFLGAAPPTMNRQSQKIVSNQIRGNGFKYDISFCIALLASEMGNHADITENCTTVQYELRTESLITEHRIGTLVSSYNVK